MKKNKKYVPKIKRKKNNINNMTQRHKFLSLFLLKTTLKYFPFVRGIFVFFLLIFVKMTFLNLLPSFAFLFSLLFYEVLINMVPI